MSASTADASYSIKKDAGDSKIDYFKLLGKIIGKAIFDRITVDAYFDRSVINYIIGKANCLEDMSFIDQDVMSLRVFGCD